MRFRYALFVLVVALPFAACSDDPVSEDVGDLLVTVTTTGTGVDSDGYLVALDAGTAVAVTASNTFTDLTVGAHTVTISGVAASCTVAGDLTVTVDISSDSQATVAFTVNCTVA